MPIKSQLNIEPKSIVTESRERLYIFVFDIFFLDVRCKKATNTKPVVIEFTKHWD